MRDFITARDYGLMRRVHAWEPPRWFQVWMLGATRGGDGWLWVVAGALVLLFGGPERFLVAEVAGLAAGAGVVLFLILKRLTGRRRPCAIAPHVWCTLLPPDQFSFPSGHSITAFAVAVSLAVAYPAAAPLLLFCAASVAASRIVLGMHFLSDVLAGSILGVLLAFASWSLLS
ncbi:MAG: phosphatase PAP2 family protein [Bryobacterales bacterium]|nr:phosphatase PAP2 family protein [Bryobacteraceae bacterium]MDW8354555.1 phosphatase PAP2 family protein [Bryobacterales bacterium]